MHSFKTVLNDTAAIDRTTPVRVQCEAQDCRALLEVNLSPGQRTDRPVIVRCGSCKRLLEVDLAQAGLAGLNQHRDSSNVFTRGSSTTSTALFQGGGDGFGVVPTGAQLLPTRFNNGARGPSELHLTNASKLRPQALLQPPPLSRYTPFHQNATLELPSDLFSWYTPWHNYGSFLGSPLDPFKSPEYNDGDAVSEKKPKAKKQKASKVRHPSPYNMFMSEEVKRIKAMNPSIDHKEAFKTAANNWAKSPHNCSNRRMPSPFKPPSSIATPLHELEAGIAPMESNVGAQRLEFENTIATSNFKRRAADPSPEDSANTEEKRRKTDLECLEASKKSKELSDIIKEGEVV